MKKTKLIISMVLVLALALTMSFSASAGVLTGTITVENPIASQKYYIYRIFDLETYNKTDNAYSYILNDQWDDFAILDNIRGTYITLDTSIPGKTYVKWIDGADVNSFAKAAIEWGKNNVDYIDSKTSETGDDIVFENLPLGYYLIDSSVGALCSLTTTDPDAVVKEKNELTTIEKLVKENSTNDYRSENSAKIGDTVSFKSEITLGEGVENLIVHDIMDKGLTLKNNSFKVYVQQSEVAESNFTIKTTNLDNDCTFEISFSNAYVASLSKGSVIRVEYDAILNSNAKVSEDPNNNTTWVSYGDKLTSTESKTKTYCYKFDLFKTNDKSVVIGTAEFYLYDTQNNGNIIKLVVVSEDEDKGIYVYRAATENDTVSGNGAAIKAGYATILGLDKQVYYLEETRQPTGYNKLSERVKVDLTNGNIDADVTEAFFKNGGSVIGADASTVEGLKVINKTGTVLPGTGGSGTSMFYVTGGILIALGSVLFITKNRMSRKHASK